MAAAAGGDHRVSGTQKLSWLRKQPPVAGMPQNIRLYNSEVGAKMSMFDNKAKEHRANQLVNPFSDWKGAGTRVRLSRDDPNYGRPLEGSKTAERGRQAQVQMIADMVELCDFVYDCGIKSDDGRGAISFGDLFRLYSIINDKCVGLLMRARKHGILDFEGEMLFQRRDDDKMIELLLPLNTIRHKYGMPMRAGCGDVCPELLEELARREQQQQRHQQRARSLDLLEMPQALHQKSRSMELTSNGERSWSLTPESALSSGQLGRMGRSADNLTRLVEDEAAKGVAGGSDGVGDGAVGEVEVGAAASAKGTSTGSDDGITFTCPQIILTGNESAIPEETEGSENCATVVETERAPEHNTKEIAGATRSGEIVATKIHKTSTKDGLVNEVAGGYYTDPNTVSGADSSSAAGNGIVESDEENILTKITHVSDIIVPHVIITYDTSEPADASPKDMKVDKEAEERYSKTEDDEKEFRSKAVAAKHVEENLDSTTGQELMEIGHAKTSEKGSSQDLWTSTEYSRSHSSEHPEVEKSAAGSRHIRAPSTASRRSRSRSPSSDLRTFLRKSSSQQKCSKEHGQSFADSASSTPSREKYSEHAETIVPEHNFSDDTESEYVRSKRTGEGETGENFCVAVDRSRSCSMPPGLRKTPTSVHKNKLETLGSSLDKCPKEDNEMSVTDAWSNEKNSRRTHSSSPSPRKIRSRSLRPEEGTKNRNNRRANSIGNIEDAGKIPTHEHSEKAATNFWDIANNSPADDEACSKEENTRSTEADANTKKDEVTSTEDKIISAKHEGHLTKREISSSDKTA